MTMENSRCSIKIGNNLTDQFDVKKGFRQGDALSCDFFNIVLEGIVKNSNVNTRGTIFQKSVQLLAYADDIDIIGRTQRDVNGAFVSVQAEAEKMGLAVNEGKTKYMLSTRKDTQHRRLGQNVSIDSYNFEEVKYFVCLGSAINTENDTSTEIKRRITIANPCFFGLYGAEAWTLTKADEYALGCFEGKILRLIYGPVCIDGEWRRRFNQELYELYNDADLVKRIKVQRLRWLGHVERMDTNAPTRKVLESTPAGRRSRGKPRLRWRTQV